MTDLTVLISPTPLYVPMMRARPFSFRRSTPNLITPTMVTLETEREPEDGEPPEAGAADTQSDSEPTQDDAERPQPRRRGRALSRIVDPNLLSPPVNTFKSSGHTIPPPVKRHKPTRSLSAPARYLESAEQQVPGLLQPFVPEPPSTAINRSFPRRTFASRSSEALAKSLGSGNLPLPPPPLLRPTTFWRKTRRSGVTAASYSPSYHLIRRSTFIAAGLAFDSPTHDLSAFSVENRVGFIVVPPDTTLQ
ncbi:hypothetical protein F5887DRAFT_228875 [Amanita rubescens]|nr:hypothetical protein F5887DRAFT_511166 [Amanita rubescens]KAF8345066.1 hypothetical protein F5887DRAFT_228875 [Amanita rubescens]